MNPAHRPAAAAVAPRWHAHADETALVGAVCAQILQVVGADRGDDRASLLLLSGGSTPVPVYRALADQLAAGRAGLAPGTARLTISLVDERFVAPQDPGSNERMLRQTFGGLLGDDAHAALRFWPLVDWPGGRARSVAQANERMHAAPPPSLVLLGMGDDGHTASLFPGSPDLAAALATSLPYVALDAPGCPGAGAWPLRITLTPAGWRPARRRLLLLRGAHKREVYERALREGDAAVLPVAAAIALGEAPLDVHWAP